ncbi:MAG: hypothetical protein ABIW46_00985 [Acidimicrobiales bacterium]
MLRERAARQGQSLQRYLAGELAALARRPTVDEVLDRIEGHRGGRVGFDRAVAAVSDERVRR